MRETEVLMWLGISVGSLLIVALALGAIAIVFMGIVSGIGWLYDRYIRWRVRSGRE